MEAPITYLPPRFLSSASRYFAAWDVPEAAGLFTSGVFNNIATAHPFRIPFSYPVRRVFWANGSAVAGSVEVGLYTPAGQQFWTSGLVVQAGTNVLQYVSVDFVLPPGTYYLVGVGNNNAGTFFKRAITTLYSRAAGVLQKSASAPLPASLSGFVVPSTGEYWLFGLTMTSSGF